MTTAETIVKKSFEISEAHKSNWELVCVGMGGALVRSGLYRFGDASMVSINCDGLPFVFKGDESAPAGIPFRQAVQS